nr:MAG TPA: tail needle [Caudoviricetes sp.]
MMANEKLLTDAPFSVNQLTPSMLPENFTASYRLHVLTQADNFQTSSDFLRFVASATYDAQADNDRQDNEIAELKKDSVSKTKAGTQHIASSLDTDGVYMVGGTQVIGPRQTGWTAATGTPLLGSFNANQSYTIGTTHTQSEVAALATGLQQARQRILALETVLRLHGLID